MSKGKSSVEMLSEWPNTGKEETAGVLDSTDCAPQIRYEGKKPVRFSGSLLVQLGWS